MGVGCYASCHTLGLVVRSPLLGDAVMKICPKKKEVVWIYEYI